MMTDDKIRTEGRRLLIEALGLADTERFIRRARENAFDYTKWHSENDLAEGMSIDEFCALAEEASKKADEWREWERTRTLKAPGAPRTDEEVVADALKVLSDNLGVFEAGHFYSLMGQDRGEGSCKLAADAEAVRPRHRPREYAPSRAGTPAAV